MFLLSPVPLSLPSVDITCSSCLRLYFWGNLNLRHGSFIYAHVSRLGFHTVIVSFRQELAQDSPLAVKRLQMLPHHLLSQSEGCCPPCYYHLSASAPQPLRLTEHVPGITHFTDVSKYPPILTVVLRGRPLLYFTLWVWKRNC